MTAPGGFEGKVAVITGGASGIGRQIAGRLVEEGGRVVLGDRNGDLLTEVAEELGGCLTCVVDVTVEADVERLVASATDAYGRLDIGINCAGVGSLAPIVNLRRADWDNVFDVCMTGVFLSTKHEARAMLRGGLGGVILNVASINGRLAAEGMSAYCSAKAGVEMFTRVAALELAEAGIRVVGLAPGFIDTPMTAATPDGSAIRDAYIDHIPLGRVGSTSDVSDAALFLTSDQAGWITGETLVVDGGETMRGYPRLLRLAGQMAAGQAPATGPTA